MSRIISALIFSAAMLAAASDASGDSAPDFKGKTITIYVGATAGGGYDLYARTIARYLPKYLPGTPSVVVTNMPGAGSNIAAGFIAANAPKDGTAIGALFSSATLEPLIGSIKIRHDPSKFNYVGSANDEVFICVVKRDSPVKTIEDAKTTEILLGAQNSSTLSDYTLLINDVLTTKFKLVLGYPGSREIALALENGEVQGACGLAWPSVLATYPTWFGPTGTMRVLAQAHPTGHSDLNAQGIPNVYTMTTNEADKAAFDLFFTQSAFGRPYVLPPDTPKAVTEVIRSAFNSALADPGLLREAKVANLDIKPLPGEDMQKLIEAVYASPKAVVDRVKRALGQ